MQRTPKIILLIESSRASGRALLQGIADFAHHHGPWSFYWEPGGLEKAWPLLPSLDADGIIMRDVDQLSEVLALGIPAVVVGHSKTEVPGLANVVTDSPTIGRMAAEHLLNCGVRHFAYCGYDTTPWEKCPWSELRGDAFHEKVKEAGFGVHFYPRQSATVSLSWKHERQRMAAWLLSLPRPLGLMACNDDRGQQVIEACRTAALTVPDDVAVLGVDNDELVCSLSDPPLSSVAINFERAGYDAAASLGGLLNNQKDVPRKILVHATHIVARRSTDILALEDPHVVKALRFIQEQCRSSLSVSEVVRAAALSRRALEERFRRMVGRSILQEIRRVRVDHISRLLVETNLPVSQIADALGFSDIRHFARYFHSETKSTPLAHRKKLGRA